MLILNDVLFWAGAILSVISAYRMCLSERKQGYKAVELHISPRAFRILLALAVLTAVAVRIYRFGLVPGGFNQDGAMAAVDGKALAEYGTDRFGMRLPVHLTAWGYGQMSALLSYLMAPFIGLFGLSACTARLPLLLVSLAGLVCLYGFVRDAFGKNAALIVLWFAAINPWHILQSRWALDCNLYSHFFMAGVFLLNRAFLGGKRRRYLLASMAAFGLCMYCYGVSIYTMPVFLLASCIYLLASGKVSPADVLLSAAVYLLVAWPFIAVMTINFFRWDTVETPLFTLPFFPDSVRSGDILFFSPDILSQLGENIRALLRVTVLQGKDLPWNDVQDFGTMYLFSAPFAALGLFGLWRRLRGETGAAILGIFLGTGIWCGIATNTVNVNRLNIIYYPIMILTGYGIYEVVRSIRLPQLKLGMATAYAGAFLLFVNMYFTGYAEEMEGHFRRDFGEAVSSLKGSGAEKLYITVGAGQHTALTEILTLFWCDVDAAYFQGKSVPEGGLPYRERYIYHEIYDIAVDFAEDAVYVIVAEELPLFDGDRYAFRQFGRYYVVTRKGDGGGP